MAQMAVDDGTRVMVASPHLFRGRTLHLSQINDQETILQRVAELRQKLSEAAIPLEIIPGCDFPLGVESLELLDAGRAMTINGANRYLLWNSLIPPCRGDGGYLFLPEHPRA